VYEGAVRRARFGCSCSAEQDEGAARRESTEDKGNFPVNRGVIRLIGTAAETCAQAARQHRFVQIFLQK
jgi:hypothetical protein